MQTITIIGGGAAGMACAVLLARQGKQVTILERGDRLGRKLSASGNGQGNVTNTAMDASHYLCEWGENRIAHILSRFSAQEAVAFLESMGGIFLPDSRGRVYPVSRQASAVTDLFRRELTRLGVRVCTGAHVTRLAHDGDFFIGWEGGHMRSDAVILAAGGKAAKNFGTDGTAYALARSFGHTVTPLRPALVQLRTDPAAVRGLKGIRLDANITLRGKSFRGDLLFTESGISGDAVFRASFYAREGDVLTVDLLPQVSMGSLSRILEQGEDALLCVLPNGLSRFLYRRNEGDLAALIKNFPLAVTGTLGFDYAQVTVGGIPLSETDEGLMSLLRRDLYFAGEILDVAGECGGYNLHWAFASAHTVAEALK